MSTFSIRQGHYRALIWGGFLAIAPIFVADSLAGSGKWIVDETNQCGTNNPFLVPGERIRWYGGCVDGKLHGNGTLIWYQGNRETERNEGSFRNGEFHGDVVTTFPDGQVVYGQYVDGVRHGDFVILRLDGRPVRARYEQGVHESETVMSDAAVTEWQRNRGKPGTTVQAVKPRRLSDKELRPRAMTPTNAAMTPPTPAPPAKRPFGGDEADGERSGGGVLSYLNPLNWSVGYLNPLNWGVVDKVTGLFGFGNDDKPSSAPAKQAVPAPRQAVPAPRQAATAPKPAPRQVAMAPKPAPRPQRSAAPPASYGTSAEEVARNWPSVTKNWYDMSVFLNESHPFVSTPDAKAMMPIVSGRIGAGVAYGGTAYTPPPPQLANGWHLAAPDPIRPAAMTYMTPSLPRQYPGAADAFFTQAYKMERTGDLSGAQSLYEQIVMQYPSAPSANLANDRLSAIQAAVAPNATAALAPPTNDMTMNPNDRVIAVNSPVPPTGPGGGTTGVGNTSPIHNSPYISKRVCSRRGLYEGDAKWCGVVRRDNVDHLVVEIRDVYFNSFGMIGITRSTCTGDAFLTWFSRGSTVRVPKKCMTIGG